MPQSYLIFDFGTNEETAQQARHRLEGWKQAFRLGEKLQLKFERQEAEKPKEQAEASAPEPAKGKTKAKDKGKGKVGEGKGPETKPDHAERIRLLVRLDFSDHERLSHQRWLERIPTEEPFKSAEKQIIRRGDGNFAATRELFDSLK